MLKRVIITLSIFFQVAIYSQEDTLQRSVKGQETINGDTIHINPPYSGDIPVEFYYQDRQKQYYSIPDSLIIDKRWLKNDTLESNGITYDHLIGETYSVTAKANGWRIDTLGGVNKQVYSNPYIEGTSFRKSYLNHNLVYYRYKDGKLYTGPINDTIIVKFSNNKVEGYIEGKPYKVVKDLQAIFMANCVNGVIQGEAYLSGFAIGYVDKVTLSISNFVDGEMVGITKIYDVNLLECNIIQSRIAFVEKQFYYADLMKKLSRTELTYVKGIPEWIIMKSISPKGKTKTKYSPKYKYLKKQGLL
jgi:hypothetical protein